MLLLSLSFFVPWWWWRWWWCRVTRWARSKVVVTAAGTVWHAGDWTGPSSKRAKVGRRVASGIGPWVSVVTLFVGRDPVPEIGRRWRVVLVAHIMFLVAGQ